MLSGTMPFYDENQKRLHKKIVREKLAIPNRIQGTARSIIEQLMRRDPSKRLGARRTIDVQEHEFFAGMDWSALWRREVRIPGLRAAIAAATKGKTDELGSNDLVDFEKSKT